jgi:hypothetical protein
MNFLKREYAKSVAARMLRMTPAYGIGGVCNIRLRRYFLGDFENLGKKH